MTRARWIGLFAVLLALAGCTEPAELDTSAPELLYEGPVGWSPELSPDGTYLAIPEGVSYGDDEAVDMLLLDMESGEITNLTQYNPLDGITQDARYPCWSPDGEYVYFIQVEGWDPIYSVCRIPSAGGDIETILTLPEARLLGVNGAGTELAFYYRDDNYSYHIGRYDLTSGGLTDVPGGDDLG
ncbi:MAG TPA: hypothetical protein VM054_01665 [bacterium]|nr:hypothetical protein [bacterium]